MSLKSYNVNYSNFKNQSIEKAKYDRNDKTC